MLDWRGVTGSVLVHMAAIGGWPVVAVGPTTLCLCAPFGNVVTIVPKHVSAGVLNAFAVPAGTSAPTLLVTTSACTGGTEGASPPTLLTRTAGLIQLADAPFAACVSVDTAGGVAGYSIRQSGGRSAATLRVLRRDIEALRFSPAKLDGRAVPYRIEVRLTAIS